MKRADRAFWIARFDIESLIGTILRGGTWITLGLLLVSAGIQWETKGQLEIGSQLRAKSVPLLVYSGLEGVGSPLFWFQLFVHLGVGVLLLTPYVRVAATLMYFSSVEPSKKRILSTGLVLILLTIILLSDWV